MARYSDLDKRMKGYYEEIPKIKLMRRTPVIIRLDGKAFHTFTRGFQKPFDDILISSMQDTMKYLCENIQGCVLGYTQSDEITLILVDYKKLNSSAWFDYEVQKMCSISASMATMAFNKAFHEEYYKWGIENLPNFDMGGTNEPVDESIINLSQVYDRAANRGAMFDSRVFNIPKEEVTNCLFWRQDDASKNSIQMVGQANFYHKELQGKSCNDIQNMLLTERGINWNDLPTYKKRGSCCIKENYEVCVDGVVTTRSHWVIDNDIPIFKGECREYIERLINFEVS